MITGQDITEILLKVALNTIKSTYLIKPTAKLEVPYYKKFKSLFKWR
jgi:hypothetical protein